MPQIAVEAAASVPRLSETPSHRASAVAVSRATATMIATTGRPQAPSLRTSKTERRIPTRMIPRRSMRRTENCSPGRKIAAVPTVFATARPRTMAIEIPEIGLARPAGSRPSSERTTAPIHFATNSAPIMTATDEGEAGNDLENAAQTRGHGGAGYRVVSSADDDGRFARLVRGSVRRPRAARAAGAPGSRAPPPARSSSGPPPSA